MLYKWPDKWITGVITPLSGVITPLVTGPTLQDVLKLCFAKQGTDENQCKKQTEGNTHIPCLDKF